MKNKTSVLDDDYYDNYDFVNACDFEAELYEPYPYKVYIGGRSSRKSTLFAKALLRLSFEKKCFILCIRKTQKSLDDSSLRLLKEVIAANPFYVKTFKVLSNKIINPITGSEFVVRGLSTTTAGSMRSLQGVTHVWIEEGQYIEAMPWHSLSPTIRKEGAEVWITMNPIHESDVLYNEFVTGAKFYGSDLLLKEMSWRDNPYLSERTYRELMRDKAKDYDMYMHKWEGKCLINSEAQVFKYNRNWVIREFDDEPTLHKYQGLDFGFSQDPTFATQSFVKDKTLYVRWEAVAKNLELDEIGVFCEERIPDWKKYLIMADSASPAIIRFLEKQGYNIEGVKKGAGSVEAGVEFLKAQFDKIIIHPDCINLISNMNKHEYKIDPRSGRITRDFVDANNDGIDSLRYSQEPSMLRCLNFSDITVQSWATRRWATRR